MKKLFYLFAVITASVLAFSCTTKELDNLNDSIQKNEVDKDEQPQPVITITASIPEDIDTKITITEETDYSLAKLAWEEDDQITVIGSTTSSIFVIDPESISEDKKQANFTFERGDPTPDGSSFTILYHPENPTSVEVFDGKSYDGQVQDGNGSLAHLNYAMKLVGVDNYSAISFSSDWATAHGGSLAQNSVLQMLLKLPDDVAEVYNIYVKDDGTFAQTLWLTNGDKVYATPNGKHVIKGYMMVPDMKLDAGNLTVRVETEDGAYEKAYPLTITEWTGGAQYTIQKDMSGLSAVTGEHAAMEIHAACAQDILQFKAGVIAGKSRFNGSTVTLEKNIDMSAADTWSTSIPSTFEGTFGSASSEDKKTISGISGTVPLFNSIPTGATVQNFELTGSFAFIQSGADYLGALAKTAQGHLSGVTVGANISVNIPGNEPINGLLDLGGLIGRVNNVSASIDHCCFNGSITVLSTYSNTNANGIRLGGLVGYITKQVTISSSSFEGTIKCEGEVSASATDPTDASKHPALSVGGIVGKLQNGIISGCTTTDASDALKPSVEISETAYKGSIFLKSSTYNSVAVGGIAGFCYDGSSSITGCTNATTILSNVTTEDATNVYLFSGGIVGLSRNNVTACTNNGAQQHFSTSRLQSIGGIIGRDYGTLTVSTGISNTGNITVNSAPTAATYQIAIGGIIGLGSVAIDGGSSNLITNAGNITQKFNGLKNTSTANAANTQGLFIGGIVGYTVHGLSHVFNSGNHEFVCNHVGSDSEEGGADLVHMGGIAGKVYASTLEDIAYCTNSGNLTFNPTSTAPHSDGSKATYALYAHNYLGGIVGYANLVNIKGDSSNKTTNSGNILGGDGSGNNNTADTFWVGGIVGKLTGSSSSISYCDLTGNSEVNNNHFSNKAYASYCPMCGGIAGEVLGASSAYATVSNCQIESTANVVARRGDCGGIVGYARYADLSSCTMSRSFGNSAYCYGGIVGWLRDGTVTECHFTGASITSSQMQVGGGIVGRLQSATIDGCYSHATDISKNSTAVDLTGALAGEAYGTAANNIIKKSHYKSSMTKICGSINTTYTVGTGDDANAADL